MQNQAPVSFEIDISKPEVAPTTTPQIKIRLEAESRKVSALTLDQINERQNQAAQKRALAINKQRSAAKENLEKVELNRERKNSEEMRAAAELSSKLHHADEKRNVRISQIKDKVATHNKRVTERVEFVTKSQ